MTPWEVHGRELVNCNHAAGCPCQFMALPHHPRQLVRPSPASSSTPAISATSTWAARGPRSSSSGRAQSHEDDGTLERLVKRIEIEVDIEGRRGRMSVPGVFETEAQPITNPVTGAEHRARIDLPHGFEFHVAEVAKAATGTSGAIDLANNRDSHAHLVDLHLSNSGVPQAA